VRFKCFSKSKHSILYLLSAGSRAVPNTDDRVVGQLPWIGEQHARFKFGFGLLALIALVAPFIQEAFILMHAWYPESWEEPYHAASAIRDAYDMVYDVCIVFGVLSLMLKGNRRT